MTAFALALTTAALIANVAVIADGHRNRRRRRRRAARVRR